MRKLYYFILSIVLISCKAGYQKIDDQWCFVAHNEGGKNVQKMTVDEASFEILENTNYAKDEQNVFWKGLVIQKANAASFEVISKTGYSKDDHAVYLDNAIIVLANPATFKELTWPYSKDDKHIFNGNLPMEVDRIDEFEVTKSGTDCLYATKKFFINSNQDYAWLDTLDVKGISVYTDAEGQTTTSKYKGYRKIDE